MSDQAHRYRRFYEDRFTPRKSNSDLRTPAQRDRDRILYSSAFRRLAEVTQVISPDSGYVFHNRLTHSLQVAQVGRRLAERLRLLFSQEVDESPGIDPDVVEAACLAHDLGHPPFGHLAERVLNERSGLDDGFEGNAQSFRIVTRLAFRSKDYQGLDLTRATLSAILKYPWLRNENPNKLTKWGAYNGEHDQFLFARDPQDNNSFEPSIEAQLMNLADDITYSVHDMEDFYRAGLIPLHLLAAKDGQEREKFFADVFRRNAENSAFVDKRAQLQGAFTHMVTVSFWLREAYTGTADHRAALRGFTGELIDRYVKAIQLQLKGPNVVVKMDPDLDDEMTMFKQLIWTYVIDAPGLATQQVGQAGVISRLYDVFCDSALSSNPKLFPAFYRERLSAAESDADKRRICVDFIASLTEAQSMNIFRRISGATTGVATEALTFL